MRLILESISRNERAGPPRFSSKVVKSDSKIIFLKQLPRFSLNPSFSRARMTDLDKLNLVKLSNGGLVRGQSQCLQLVKSESEIIISLHHSKSLINLVQQAQFVRTSYQKTQENRPPRNQKLARALTPIFSFFSFLNETGLDTGIDPGLTIFHQAPIA